MQYLITGGTGYIGSALIKKLENQGNSFIILSRTTKQQSKYCKIITSLDQLSPNTKIDAVINLSGSPIDRIWNTKIKQDIIDSRVNTTKNLVAFLKRLKTTPKVMISASAIGYYGNNPNVIITEDSKPQASFTHTICKLWEDEATKVEKLGIRLCIIRISVVLGQNSRMIKKILLPFKLGLGGKFGSGNQIFSWIHIEDLVRAIIYLVKNNNSIGIYNLAAGDNITNQEFITNLGNIIHRPTFCTVPQKLIKLIWGEMGQELLLTNQNIYPKRLIKEGFKFNFDKINRALQDILQ